jgi:hypothetical protein
MSTTKKSKDTACANGAGKATAKPKTARTPAGEKSRKAGIAEAAQRIKKIEADEAAGSALVPTYPGANYAEPAPDNHTEQETRPATEPPAPTPDAAPIPKPAKGRKAKAPKTEQPAGPMSGLDAAAKVLAEAGVPMNVKDLTESILTQKLWFTDGKTPGATIYAAIIREIAAKGPDSRFRKTDRGLFEATEKGG